MKDKIQNLDGLVKASLKALRRIGPAGVYWDSDELMDAMRYVQRKVWLEIVRKARSTCRCGEEDVVIHFRRSEDPIPTGGRPRIKYELTAYACWLIAGHCAPRHPGVSAAKDYFKFEMTMPAEEPVRGADHVACMNGPLGWPVAPEQETLVEENGLLDTSIFDIDEPEQPTGPSLPVRQIPFYGDVIEGMQDDRGAWASIPRCCESLGIDAQGQQRKLAGKSWAWVEIISTHDRIGRPQDTWMIHEESFHAWLAGIDENKVRPESRQTLIAFQKEAAKALHAAFATKEPSSPPALMDIPTILASAASLVLPIVQSQIQEAKQFNASLVASLGEKVGKDLVRVESKVDSLYQEAAFAEEDFKRQLEDQRKEIEELRKAMPPPGYATVIAYAKFRGLREVAENEFRDWGGRLKSRAKKLGVVLIPVEDVRWGIVNAYPLPFLESTFDELGPLRYRDRE